MLPRANSPSERLRSDYMPLGRPCFWQRAARKRLPTVKKDSVLALLLFVPPKEMCGIGVNWGVKQGPKKQNM